MKVTAALALALLLQLNLFAQRDDPTISIGYFAPYGIRFGGKVAATFNYKNWQKEGTDYALTRMHKLNLSPQFGYFIYPEVEHNFLFNLEAIYQYTKPNKRFVPIASIGLGYLLSRQKQGGSVHLGTGEITYDVQSIGYFMPTLNIGFDIKPKKVVGYYLRGFFGRKMTTYQENAAIFGAEAGLIFNIFYTKPS